ncbi:WD40/YVTN repeat-like-containing domain,WD40-repeat-containing domain [Cinara cedri]|uniref:WD40/YVTN repeat-like-containing domain,WD40-repeat-containing domain n=1 Tax=Cinara cedri TaxID=506608 RepID=A0A5E4MLS9_9HEMI|nr:WD40/YVTN repeat-like-containing domain,WD40-repeat-containing domain [Cinara cedri]
MEQIWDCIPVRPFGEEMHYGGVGSMSTCLWKPNIMTCGLIDNTIKVWNYVECKLLFSKHYLEHVSSISIHPNGLYSVATFMDHAEYQMIQLDDLVPLKYFPIAGYNLCSFSDSGHMFALGKKNAIDVYCSIMFEKLFSCQEHFQSVSI